MGGDRGTGVWKHGRDVLVVMVPRPIAFGRFLRALSAFILAGTLGCRAVLGIEDGEPPSEPAGADVAPLHDVGGAGDAIAADGDSATGTYGTIACGAEVCNTNSALGPVKGCCVPADGAAPFCANSCAMGKLLGCDDRLDCLALGKSSSICCTYADGTGTYCRADTACAGGRELP